jgi:diacylglycerol kinase (ATP)
MKILLVYNATAGGGKAAKKLDEVRELFSEFEIEIELIQTKYRGHATELVSQSQLEMYDGLVAAGGDGTFFEVLNGYFRNTGKCEIPLGILPVGTGNSLARDILQKNQELVDFVNLIKNRNTRKIDVIEVKNSKTRFYYANTMGLGFVSDVNRTANGIKLFGKFSYTLGVLYHTLTLKTFPLKLIKDGEELNLKNVFISFSNTRYTGGDYLLAPGARIDDGLLDLIIVNKLSRINLLRTFPLIYSGKHVETRFVDTLKARHVKIETTTKKQLSPDGELFAHTPVEITCLPSALKIFSNSGNGHYG